MIFVTAALAACRSSEAPVDGVPESPQHGTISLFSGGSEVPSIMPTATLALPDDLAACHSDMTIDACRIRTLCNPTDVMPVGAGQVALGTTPPVTISSVPVAPGSVEWHHVGDFAAGQTVTLATDGTGAVPALSASVVAPTQVTVTSRFGSMAIPSASDYELTWTGGTTGTVHLGVSSGVDGDFTLLDCSFPAAPGRGTISAATLQAFHSSGLARIDASSVATQQAANWTIDFIVGYDALWTDGSFAQANFTVAP